MWYSNEIKSDTISNVESVAIFNFTGGNETPLTDSNDYYSCQKMNFPIKKIKLDIYNEFSYDNNNSFEYDTNQIKQIQQFNYSSTMSPSFNSSMDSNLSRDSFVSNNNNEISYSDYYYNSNSNSNSNVQYDCTKQISPYDNFCSSNAIYYNTKILNEQQNNNKEEINNFSSKENSSVLRVCFEDDTLWKSFSQIGTEMIANRNGRFVF